MNNKINFGTNLKSFYPGEGMGSSIMTGGYMTVQKEPPEALNALVDAQKILKKDEFPNKNITVMPMRDMFIFTSEDNNEGQAGYLGKVTFLECKTATDICKKVIEICNPNIDRSEIKSTSKNVGIEKIRELF